MRLNVARSFWILDLGTSFVGQIPAQTSAAYPRFAVQFESHDGSMPMVYALPASAPPSMLLHGQGLQRLAGSDPSMEVPSAIKLDFSLDGNTVSIALTAYFGIADFPNANPSVLEKLRHTTFPAHAGKLDDIVSLSELGQVGLEPLTLRIVSAQTENPYRPILRSDVPSIQIDYTTVDRTMGKVTVSNLSQKSVIGFALNQSDGEIAHSGSRSLRGGMRELIAPGGTHQMSVGVPRSGRIVNGAFLEEPPPDYLILASVLFSGGTFEGDSQTAAKMACADFGAQVQLERIRAAAVPIVAAEGPDDAAKINQLHAAIKSLSALADAATIVRFHEQFSTIPLDDLTKVESELARARKSENESTDHLLEENAPIFLQHAGRIPLAKWWNTMVEPR